MRLGHRIPEPLYAGLPTPGRQCGRRNKDKDLMPRRVSEILTGIVVIVIAALFLGFALTRAKAVNKDGYLLHAGFGHIGSLGVGEAVKIAGVSVGHVTATALNSRTYAADVTFAINKGIGIPKDSSAAIESTSLLGGEYLSISPGASNTMLKPGQAITVTQSAINVETLLGKFIFSAASMAGTMGKAAHAGSAGAASSTASKASNTSLPGLAAPKANAGQ
jgi:phospholipid/cholesterol/gamma-HCH transport system substrate-binding protein